jgi:hypothetical protein
MSRCLPTLHTMQTKGEASKRAFDSAINARQNKCRIWGTCARHAPHIIDPAGKSPTGCTPMFCFQVNGTKKKHEQPKDRALLCPEMNLKKCGHTRALLKMKNAGLRLENRVWQKNLVQNVNTNSIHITRFEPGQPKTECGMS